MCRTTFQSVLDTCGGSFRAALTNYRDTLVAPEDRDGFADLLDFGLVRSTVFSSNLLEHRYRKTDGRSFCIRVTPYSRSAPTSTRCCGSSRMKR